jgi:hypothetical protein
MTDNLILTSLHNLPESLKQEVLHYILFLNKEIAKSNKTEVNRGRVFGRAKGKYILSPDFDAPVDDFKEYM